jgi:hypothetical protein
MAVPILPRITHSMLISSILISRTRTPVAETTRKQRRGSSLVETNVETNVAKVRLIVGCYGNARARTADPMSIQSLESCAHRSSPSSGGRIRSFSAGHRAGGTCRTILHLPTRRSPRSPWPYDECTKSEHRKAALRTIPKVGRPRKDPVFGSDGPLLKLCRPAIDRRARTHSGQRKASSTRNR